MFPHPGICPRSMILNEAPKPRLRRYARAQVGGDDARCSSMKLRSRDFGDVARCVALCLDQRSSMKLRSRDFGDSAHASCMVTGQSILNEAPKPRLRRYLADAQATAEHGQSSMKLRSRDFGDGKAYILPYGNNNPQ